MINCKVTPEQIKKLKEYRECLKGLPIAWIDEYVRLSKLYDIQNTINILDLKTNIEAWECIVLGENIDNDLLVNEDKKYYNELTKEELEHHVLTLNIMYKQKLQEICDVREYCKKLELLLTPKE